MLKHKIEIYVPNNTPDQYKVMMEVFEKFCKKFGEATINPVLGGWIDNKGKLITDKIGIVYSYSNTFNKAWVKALAIHVREKLEEDAVTAVIDGNAEFY